MIRTYEKEYPFGWLGVLSETPPLPDLVYCNHERGFALASSATRCSAGTTCSARSTTRSTTGPTSGSGSSSSPPPAGDAAQVVTGPSIEKSIAPLRSFVAEPMRFGNLFLAGDAAHIVPPTGAKGLNLAISDVYYLSRALVQHYTDHDDHYLDRYSEMALRRVWGSVRFSWWLTKLLHRFPDQTEFDQRAQGSTRLPRLVDPCPGVRMRAVRGPALRGLTPPGGRARPRTAEGTVGCRAGGSHRCRGSSGRTTPAIGSPAVPRFADADATSTVAR